MGESKKDVLKVNFKRKLKLKSHGVKVTTVGAVLPALIDRKGARTVFPRGAAGSQWGLA